MASLSTSSGPRGPSPGRPIEQLLVMHCLKEDSVLGREGFSVRAASPGASDRDTLDWAMRLDPYQLPLDMKSGMLLANQAPRRLAMVPGPSGQAALVHTAYLPEDTVGRNHSFISQVLLVPELSTIEAVAAWGAPDWQTDEYSQGDTKSLPRLDDIPHGSLLDEATLSAFLSGAPAPADQSLARSVFPGRVELNPEARRRWVRAALHGFLLTVDANSTRTRVCILAEPGAVALLVYAIARLLPPQLVGTVPFSTYEPPDTSLRENKVARVIGSYARNGLIPSASDALRRKGYVVDTFRDAYGPDLLVESSFPLEGLLNLAAEGDWAAVDELRDLWSRDPQLVQSATPASLAEAVRARPLVVALKAGTIGADGLIELRRNRFGEGLLRDPGRRRLVWEAVRTVWSRPGIRVEFSDLLREHLDDLLDEVRALAQSGPAGPWREGWEVVKPLVPADRRAGDYASFLDLAGKSQAAAATVLEDRIAMLREWAQLAPRDAAVPGRLYWLLRAPDASGFRALARSGLEPRHVGLAACVALAGSSGREHGPGLVQELADESFQAMLAELASFSHKEAVFDHLRSSPDMIRALVERLLQSRAKVPPAQVEDILSGMRCDEAIGHGFWLQGKHLEGLLDRLESDSKLSRRLWAGLIARITHENFASSGVGAEMETLAAAREKFPSSLAAEDRDRLDGWTALRAHFAAPQKDPAPGTAARLRKACEAVGQSRETLTREWFRRRVLTASGDLERKRRNETLGQVLLGFYETEDNAWYAARKLASDAPDDEQRRLCEADLQKAILSEETWDRLAAKDAGEPRGAMGHAPSLRGPSGRGKGRGQKVWDRLKPHVAPFVAGSLVTVLLILLLWLPISALYQNATTRGGTRTSDEGDRREKSLLRLRDQVAEREAKIEQRTKQLDAREASVNQREAAVAGREEDAKEFEKKRVADATPGGQRLPASGQPGNPGQTADGKSSVAGQGAPKPGGAAAKSGDSIGEINLDHLERRVLQNSLFSADHAIVLELARAVEQQKLGTPRSQLATAVRSLLTGLSAYDVEIDKLQILANGKEKKTNPETKKIDFSFLFGGPPAPPILATLRAAPPVRSRLANNTVSFYVLPTSQGAKNPRVFTTWPDYDFLAAAPSGRFFLMARSDRKSPGIYTDVYRVESARFYEDNQNRPERSAAPMNDPKLELSIDQPGTKLAISNDARKVAIATPASDLSGRFPTVVVHELRNQKDPGVKTDQPAAPPTESSFKDGDNKRDGEPNLVEFNPSGLNLDPGIKVMAMSFDAQGRTLIVGFEDRSQLVALGLGPDRSFKKSTNYGKPIRGWALSAGGKLAVATELQIYLVDFISLREGREKDPRPLASGQMTPHLKCVAFGPKGTTLATGDENGNVSIRLLGTPFEGREVLRLAHVGPVTKVGFSPDGRILAALARPVDMKGDSEGGVIRLWVNENWEAGDSDKWGILFGPGVEGRN